MALRLEIDETSEQSIYVQIVARGTKVARRAGPAGAFRPDMLSGLMRPVAVAAFHMGATAEDLRVALDAAMQGIFALQGEGEGEGEV